MRRTWQRQSELRRALGILALFFDINKCWLSFYPSRITKLLDCHELQAKPCLDPDSTYQEIRLGHVPSKMIQNG
jgi:hypothetical protein